MNNKQPLPGAKRGHITRGTTSAEHAKRGVLWRLKDLHDSKIQNNRVAERGQAICPHRANIRALSIHQSACRLDPIVNPCLVCPWRPAQELGREQGLSPSFDFTTLLSSRSGCFLYLCQGTSKLLRRSLLQSSKQLLSPPLSTWFCCTTWLLSDEIHTSRPMMPSRPLTLIRNMVSAFLSKSRDPCTE